MSSPEKKPFHVPHQLVILFAIAVLATIATYVVPAGTYNTVTVNGRKIIDATTFHYIAQTPVNPWQAFLALPGGFTKQVGIIAMMLMAPAIIMIMAMMPTCLVKPPGRARNACQGLTGVCAM